MSLSLFSGCNKTATESDEWIESEYEIVVEDGDNTNSDSSSGTSQLTSGGKTSQTSQGGSSGASGSGEVRDLGGRTITYLTYWSEPVKGKTDRETKYWKVKTEIEKK